MKQTVVQMDGQDQLQTLIQRLGQHMAWEQRVPCGYILKDMWMFLQIFSQWKRIVSTGSKF
jgi:hypothetical protein